MASSKFGPSLLLLSLAGCATTASSPHPVPASAVTLSDQRILSTLMEKKLYGTTQKGGHPYTITFSADGTDVFHMPPSPPETERWTLSSGVVCVMPRQYPKECSVVKTDNGEYWFVDPGSGKVNAYLKTSP